MEKEEANVRLWHRTFLIIAGVVEIVLEFSSLIFISIVGYHGFKAGEMGTMIGLFTVLAFILLLPLAVVRVVAVYGLWKKRRWAAIITIILSVVLFLSSLLAVTTSLFLFIVILLYVLFSIWAAIACMRHPDFR
jgi:hypothetical protein